MIRTTGICRLPFNSLRDHLSQEFPLQMQGDYKESIQWACYSSLGSLSPPMLLRISVSAWMFRRR